MTNPLTTLAGDAMLSRTPRESRSDYNHLSIKGRPFSSPFFGSRHKSSHTLPHSLDYPLRQTRPNMKFLVPQTLMLLSGGSLVSGALDRDKALSIGIVLVPLSPSYTDKLTISICSRFSSRGSNLSTSSAP